MSILVANELRLGQTREAVGQSCCLLPLGGTKSSVVVGYFIAAINILFLSLEYVSAGRLTTGRWRKKRANYQPGLVYVHGARFPLSWNGSFLPPRVGSPLVLAIDSSNRGEVSTMVGVPIRISYSNVDSIHGSIMGYEGEWRDQIYTRGYLRRDSNREEGFHTRAHTRTQP